MKTASVHAIDMCNGPILKKMLLFAVPLMLSGILQLLFNAADIVVVGRFAGDNALAAVGSNTSLIGLLTNLFMGLSTGASVLTANMFGAKREKDVSRTVHTAMLLSFCCGVILTVVGIIGARRILIWMQTPSEVLELAVVYLRIYFIGITSSMIYNFGAAILRAVGDTRRPLYYLIIAGVLNVVLNLVFVIVFKLSVAGVAIATVISQTLSAIFIVRCLTRETGAIRLVLRELRIDADKFRQILRIGLPAGVQGIIFALSNVVIQSSVNLFGATVVAGNSAAANVESFAYFSMNAFYHVAISFTGQNIGAGKLNRIRRIVWTAEACVIVVGVCVCSATILGGRALLSIYTQSPEVIEAGLDRFYVICLTYVLCGMMEVMIGALRGIGYSFVPMLVSLAGVCGLRLVWIATVFQHPRFHNVTTVYASYPISWVITFVVLVICFIAVRKRLNRPPAARRGTSHVSL